MNTLDSFPKSRLFILLFVLTFTSLPGAFSLNAKTTGNFKGNNYVYPSTRCNPGNTDLYPDHICLVRPELFYPTPHTSRHSGNATHYTLHTTR